MGKEKFRCYGCERPMTNNGTELRKNPDIRVQRCTCRYDNCYVTNVFIIIDSDNKTLIGKYFYPKIKGRVFTFAEAKDKYQRKEEILDLTDTEIVIDLFDRKKMVKLVIDRERVDDEARKLTKLEYRKKAVEEALERNRRKLAKLSKELEELEVEIDEVKYPRNHIRTREDAKLEAEDLLNSKGQRLKL